MMLVSVHNAYVVAKHHDAIRAKRDWPEFQDFVEAVAHELVTTTADRVAPTQEGPLRANLKHDVQKIFRTKKACKVCCRKAGAGARRRVTLHGCVQCHEPCHPKCIVDHIRHHNVVVNNRDSDDDSDTDEEI